VCAFLFELPLHVVRAAPGPGGDVSYTDYPEHAWAVYHSLAALTVYRANSTRTPVRPPALIAVAVTTPPDGCGSC
jgi:hypothetical protein